MGCLDGYIYQYMFRQFQRPNPLIQAHSCRQTVQKASDLPSQYHLNVQFSALVIATCLGVLI